MIQRVPTIWKRPLTLAVAVALVAIPLTVGTLFAATAGDSPPFHQSPTTAATTTTLPEDVTDPGVNQVTPQGADALAHWLEDRPEVTGPFTVAEAMSADSQTVDWMLYQAVYKRVMTPEEAETFRAWHSQRPDSRDAPELMRYQPSYLYRPYHRDRLHEMFQETESG